MLVEKNYLIILSSASWWSTYLIMLCFNLFHFYTFYFKCIILYKFLMISLYECHVVTEVHGRTFGVWTLLTCTLCFLCAFNLENKPIYLATFLSFIYAFGHFLTEYLIYRTMAIANLTTVGIFAGMNFLIKTNHLI